MPYVLGADGEVTTAQGGGKASALAALARAGLPVPPWFVVTPEAFDASLSPAQRKTLDDGRDAGAVQQVLAQIDLGAVVRESVDGALAVLCPRGGQVAVRSSAVDEDGAAHSFAGQLESYLSVAPQDVSARVLDVWRSGFTERVLAYRREAGMAASAQVPRALVQRMIDAEVAGVAFGADPVSGRRGRCVVAAVYGLGSSLVSGESDADTWHVNRDGTIVRRDIVTKPIAHRAEPGRPEGVRAEAVAPHLAEAPALTDEQVRAVAALARRAGAHFGLPQDIEWAFADGELYLLQSRPITSLKDLADPDGELNIWDNSNIAESYGGITAPLTFSFARRAYEEVYRQFCRILKVPEGVIEAHDETFRRMLGLVRGRVYYNLLSWYRVLALLPGFTVNRRFMEQMMGVKEGLPEEIARGIAGADTAARLKDGLRLGMTLIGLTVSHFRLPGQIRRFHRRLDQALDLGGRDLEGRRADELAHDYRALEQRLLTRWDAPLVNDFFAMVFYGVLRQLTERWCGDTGGTLQNDLLCGEGGMISTEPARRVREMARAIQADAALVQRLREGSLAAILSVMQRSPELTSLYEDYLERFGDRCLDELKLESETLHDNPLPLLRSVGQLAHRMRSPAYANTSGVEAQIRAQAENRVAQALAGRPLRRWAFGWVLRHARARVRDRENLRFERTRLFGRVRRLFVELGKRLYAVDALADPREVFYLQVEEILGFVQGTAVTTDLKGLAALRRAELEDFAATEAPDDRFETRGVVHRGNGFQGAPAGVGTDAADQLCGIGCCPGIVRGRVRVVHDPRGVVLDEGEVLVAERTDPGWIMLFPAAAGLLVERGSLLSHSAIVAREMGIPAVVSVPGLTRILRDGDWVELDGARGRIRRLDAPQEAPCG